MIENPFEGPAPAEVKLSRAPLSKVIGQVRFPPNLALSKADEVAAFQKRVRQDYPVLTKLDIAELTLTQNGEPEITPGVVWKFQDTGGNWDVAVSNTFVALETRGYTHRQDFLTRFEAILAAADADLSPHIATRVGVRYVNRVAGLSLDRLPSMVRNEVRGLASSTLSGIVRHTMTESQFELPGSASLVLRHGLLPSGLTYDPASVEPSSSPSWILDFDAFKEEQTAFEVANLLRSAQHFSESVYRLFRWIVTDDFLAEYGA